MNKILWAIVMSLVLLALAVGTTGCAAPADVASQNLSTAADRFEVNRRIVFYNGITGKYILAIEGLCSLGNFDSNGELSVTCKVGPGTYKKHFLGLSDNVTYFAEQLEPLPVNSYNYRVIFRPETIIPDLQLDTSGGQP